MSISPNQIMQLNEMLAEADPEYANNLVQDQQKPQSVLNPGQINDVKGQSSVARPHTKIVATVNNRQATTNASKQENVIWENEEIKDHVTSTVEDRPKPEFEVYPPYHLDYP